MGDGRGCYAGVPLTFRCSACRLADGAHGPKSKRGWRSRVRLTGRTKKRRTCSPYGRSGLIGREYECLDCKHVGWSFHGDLEGLEPAKPA